MDNVGGCRNFWVSTNKLSTNKLMGYDAYNLSLDAIKRCSSDTICIRNFLYATRDYKGVSGHLGFDDHGDVLKSLVFRKIKDGKFVDYGTRQ